jgi:uncharacterized radical SAM superfamily Fe-S cluster-containing enzyme
MCSDNKNLPKEIKVNKKDYSGVFDNNIITFFQTVMKSCASNITQAMFWAGFLIEQKRAQKRRIANLAEGVNVPPLLIYSITERCNLNCVGCYSKKLHKDLVTKEQNDEVIAKVIREAFELGINIVMLAGGEPFTKPGILDIAKTFPRLFFRFLQMDF